MCRGRRPEDADAVGGARFVGSRTRGVVDEEAVDAVGDGPVGSRHEVAVGVHGDADGAVA